MYIDRVCVIVDVIMELSISSSPLPTALNPSPLFYRPFLKNLSRLSPSLSVMFLFCLLSYGIFKTKQNKKMKEKETDENLT